MDEQYIKDRHELLLHWYYGQFAEDMIDIPDFIRAPLTRMLKHWEEEAGGEKAVWLTEGRIPCSYFLGSDKTICVKCGWTASMKVPHGQED